MGLRTGLTKAGPHGGTEEHRVGQGAQKYTEHGHRQVHHEFARHPRPEDEGQERGEGGRRGGGDGPEHALRRELVGLVAMDALSHFPVGVLGDDDGAVDQHPQAQEHSKHHHEVEGIADLIQQDDGKEEGGGDGQAHDDAAANPEGRHHDGHDQRQCGTNVTRELIDLLLGIGGLVLGVEHLDPRREARAKQFHHGPRLIHRIDEIGVDALGDLDGDGGHAVHSGVARAVLEGTADGGDVRERHYRIAIGLHGNGEEIRGFLDDPRHLHGEATLVGV